MAHSAPYIIYKLVVLVVVDEATICDDLSLIICEFSKSQLYLSKILVHNICLDDFCLILHSILDTRNEYIVIIVKIKVLVDDKWKHTPVDKV